MTSTPDLTLLQNILVEVAHKHLPVAPSSTAITQTSKPDGSVVTEVDANLQAAISEALRKYWPEIPMLGEEMTHQRQQALLSYSERGLWVLDPLDGTTNFTAGFPMFGLSLAFVEHGVSQMGVVYDPNRRECFSAEQGKGAFLNKQRLLSGQTAELRRCVANVDYKRLTGALAERLVNCPPYRSQRNLGSCVLEWCWLAASRIQLYLHGGQHLWDHAAGHLILTEAGGQASRVEGEPLYSNKLTKQSAVAADSPALYAAWFEWVQQHS